MLIKKMIVLSVFASLSILNASDSNSSKEDMGSVTVKGESEELKIAHSPMAVSVVSMKQFHGRNISLNDVLKRVAGVRVSQTGGLGSRSTIAINGLEGKQVRIFLDGKPLNSPDGSFGINDIPVQLIERIEIYKGVVPARFGGDALGGAVNVVIREFKGSYVDLTYSKGSYDTHRAAVVLKRNFEEQKIEVGVGGFFNSAANNYVMKSPFNSNLNIKRDHDSFKSFAAAIGMTIKERYFDEINLELIHYESQKEIQGIQTNIQSAKNTSEANIVSLELLKEDLLADSLDFEYNFTFVDLTTHFVDKATTCYNFDGTTKNCLGIGGEISGVPHDSNDKLEEYRNDLNLHYKLNKNHAFNFHLNSRYVKSEPDDKLSSKALGYDIGAFPSDMTNTVLSLGYESLFFDGAFVNDAGVKYYAYDYSINSQERTLVGTPKETNNNGSDFGFYESLRYSPLKGLFLKASYEHAYRFATSSELFGDGIATTASPELLPEEADNINIGVLFDRYDIWGLPWLKLEANLFYRNVKNLIKLQYGMQTSGYDNLGNIEIKGYELELNTDINKNWYLFANYTNQTLKDKMKHRAGTINTPNPTYNLDLPNVAKQFANFGVDFKSMGNFRSDDLFKVFLEAHWVDEYYHGWELSRYQDKKIESQFTQTLGLEYSMDDDALIFGFEVRNLSDEEVHDVFNYPLPGRTYHFNLRYSWFEY